MEMETGMERFVGSGCYVCNEWDNFGLYVGLDLVHGRARLQVFGVHSTGWFHVYKSRGYTRLNITKKRQSIVSPDDGIICQNIYISSKASAGG
jgi:hypothetical protein